MVSGRQDEIRSRGGVHRLLLPLLLESLVGGPEESGGSGFVKESILHPGFFLLFFSPLELFWQITPLAGQTWEHCL